MKNKKRAHFNFKCEYFDHGTICNHIIPNLVVEHVWKELKSKGLLQKKTYQSWYCVQDESFLTEHQIDLSKKISLESGHPVEWAEEENYVFQLDSFREQIR